MNEGQVEIVITLPVGLEAQVATEFVLVLQGFRFAFGLAPNRRLGGVEERPRRLSVAQPLRAGDGLGEKVRLFLAQLSDGDGVSAALRLSTRPTVKSREPLL